VDGVIVPAADVPALAAALDRLMSGDGYRSRLAARAPEIVDRFAIDRVMAQWEQLARSATSTTGVSALSGGVDGRVRQPVATHYESVR